MIFADQRHVVLLRNLVFEPDSPLNRVDQQPAGSLALQVPCRAHGGYEYTCLLARSPPCDLIQATGMKHQTQLGFAPFSAKI
jgi:hypothetical protein